MAGVHRPNVIGISEEFMGSLLEELWGAGDPGYLKLNKTLCLGALRGKNRETKKFPEEGRGNSDL